jgi:hypothetical protein
MGQKRGLEGARAYRENSQKHDFSKSDSEKFLSRKFYVGRGGSKEPPGGIIYFWTALSPNGALRARPVKDSHTRIKPLALASGHGRYITVTPEREIFPVGEWPLHMAVINL